MLWVVLALAIFGPWSRPVEAGKSQRKTSDKLRIKTTYDASFLRDLDTVRHALQGGLILVDSVVSGLEAQVEVLESDLDAFADYFNSKRLHELETLNSPLKFVYSYTQVYGDFIADYGESLVFWRYLRDVMEFVLQHVHHDDAREMVYDLVVEMYHFYDRTSLHFEVTRDISQEVVRRYEMMPTYRDTLLPIKKKYLQTQSTIYESLSQLDMFNLNRLHATIGPVIQQLNEVATRSIADTGSEEIRVFRSESLIPIIRLYRLFLPLVIQNHRFMAELKHLKMSAPSARQINFLLGRGVSLESAYAKFMKPIARHQLLVVDKSRDACCTKQANLRQSFNDEYFETRNSAKLREFWKGLKLVRSKCLQEFASSVTMPHVDNVGITELESNPTPEVDYQEIFGNADELQIISDVDDDPQLESIASIEELNIKSDIDNEQQQLPTLIEDMPAESSTKAKAPVEPNRRKQKSSQIRDVCDHLSSLGQGTRFSQPLSSTLLKHKDIETLCKLYGRIKGVATVQWVDAVTVMWKLGAEIRQKHGSKYTFIINNVPARVDCPHPKPQMGRYLGLALGNLLQHRWSINLATFRVAKAIVGT